MRPIEEGCKVRMSEELKRAFRGACRHVSAKAAGGCIRCSTAHVMEFGDCVGTVEGLVQPGCPEVNVRWHPSGLRYGYDPKHLVRAC